MSSLLERIRNHQPRHSDIRRSVLSNLRRLCATRLGSAPACPEVGVPDALLYGAGGDLPPASVIRALRNAILASEPRLTAVRIEPIRSDELGYHFQITAQLAGRRGGTLAFRTQVGPGSQLRIEG